MGKSFFLLLIQREQDPTFLNPELQKKAFLLIPELVKNDKVFTAIEFIQLFPKEKMLVGFEILENLIDLHITSPKKEKLKEFIQKRRPI